MFNGNKTREEAVKDSIAAIEEMFNAIPKYRRLQFIGCYNEVLVNLKALNTIAETAGQ